jgi:hypothetical protein
MDQLCDEAGIRRTTYALAQLMRERHGWSEASVRNYRRGSTVPNDEHAAVIASHLGEDAEYVAALLASDRARSVEARRLWERVADRCRRFTTAVILSGVAGVLAAAGMAAPSTAYADTDGADDTGDISIMRNVWSWLRRAARAVAAALETACGADPRGTA